jgi:pimeloyl-ACP methyl ester carboxylesterase
MSSDHAKERRWANHITDFIIEGKVEWLNSGTESFLSIYTRTNKASIDAIIFIHGRGMHPDWPQVIQPLRTRFPAKGWATLSLQMPVLQSDATDTDYLPLFKEVPSRIKAGLDFLSNKGFTNIILIGHSLGTNMATTYLVNCHDPRIKAFVGIDMQGNLQPTETTALDNVASLLQMHIPVLDVYGAQSYPDILASVDRRAFAISAYQASVNTRQSRIIKIKGANHFFHGHEDELVRVIEHWISKFSTTTK